MVLLSRVDRPGRTSESRQNGEEARASTARGFGGRADAGTSAKGARGSNKRRKGLSRADWGPLGKHPDVDAIVAHQRLHLRPIQCCDLIITIVTVQSLNQLVRMSHLRFAPTRMHNTRLPRCIDLIGVNQPTQQRLGFLPQIPQLMGLGRAKARLKHVLF